MLLVVAVCSFSARADTLTFTAEGQLDTLSWTLSNPVVPFESAPPADSWFITFDVSITQTLAPGIANKSIATQSPKTFVEPLVFYPTIENTSTIGLGGFIEDGGGFLSFNGSLWSGNGVGGVNGNPVFNLGTFTGTGEGSFGPDMTLTVTDTPELPTIALLMLGIGLLMLLSLLIGTDAPFRAKC